MPLHIIRQDITKVKCDAIVNSTNREMVGYSGVDYAIHTAAGPLLDEECQKIYPLDLGTAKITGAYNLPSKYVIHTSGPIWQGGCMGESSILKSCYIECLRLATKCACESIAFPLISSGIYGYPKDQVLKFAIEVISQYLCENEMTVYLCVYDKTSYEFSKQLFADIKNYIGEDEKAPSFKKYNRPTRYSSEKCATYCIDLPSYDLNVYDLPHTCQLTIREEDVSLDEYLKNMDKCFIETLFDYMDQKGVSDVDCYKRANVDRKTFNKLKNNPKQRPSKQTAVAFAIALRLSYKETQHLLSTAGLTLSGSNVFDKIIEYFIKNKNYNIYEINEALFEFDQVLLGSI